MKISALDIETASLETNAHIFEVGIVVADYDIEENQLTNLHKEGFTFDSLQQSSLYRSISVETMDFHRKIRGHEGALHLFRGSKEYPSKDLHEGFDIVRTLLSQVDQLWINGLSFDPSRLDSLKRDCGYQHELWHFRIERDVRTVYSTCRFLFQEKRSAAHRALEDALWNLDTATRYLNFIHSVKPKAMHHDPHDAPQLPLS